MNGKRHLAFEFLRACDLLLFFFAYACSYIWAAGQLGSSVTWHQLVVSKLSVTDIFFFALIAYIWNRVFSAVGAYESQRLSCLGDQLAVLGKASIIGTLGIVVLNLVAQKHYGATFFDLLFSLSTSFTLLYRVALRFALRQIRRRGRNLRAILIVGTDERARRFGLSLHSHREFGYVVIGFLAESLDTLPNGEIIGTLANLAEILRARVVDEVAISLPMHSHLGQIVSLTRICRDHGIITRVIADSIEPQLKIARMDDLDGSTLLTVTQESPLRANPALKLIFDSCVTSLLIFLLLPVFILTAVAIRLTSPGPIFFTQIRLGRNKRRFRMYKFRTMVVDAEAKLKQLEVDTGAAVTPFKMRDDPRITALGRMLRRTSIDELPQLFNVLMGDMSLVGPRPLPIRDYEGFGREHHFRRFSVKPGLSCLWQISGRSNLDFDQWMELDMEYIDKWSMWLDLKILAKTIPAVFRGDGAY